MTQLGIILPGINTTNIMSKLEMNNQTEEPGLKISNVSIDGLLELEFNQPMLHPEIIDQSLYPRLFRIELKSELDCSIIEGRFLSN